MNYDRATQNPGRVERLNYHHSVCNCCCSLIVVFPPPHAQISDHMPGRVGKQCRERYLNHLDPSLRHGPWTDEEEQLLLSLHARLNNQWAEIARQIPGRCAFFFFFVCFVSFRFD